MKYLKLYEQFNISELKEWFGNSKVVDKNNQPLLVYHGSGASDIKEFSSNFDGIWFSNDIRIAEHCSGVKGLDRPVYKQEIIKTLNSEKDLTSMFSELRSLGFVIERKKGSDKYGDKYEYILITDEYGNEYEISKYIRPQDLKHELLRDAKNYAVYLRIEKPLIVDANGSQWDNILFNDKRQSTMYISIYAKENGYDGVIFKNLSEYNIKSDVYVVYNNKQIYITN